MKVWTCKIGGVAGNFDQRGMDFPMRNSIASTYQNLVGAEHMFLFSGWGGKLNDVELSVVENRDYKLRNRNVHLLEDGKYEVINNLGIMSVKRHGEPWIEAHSELAGNKLVLALVHEIERLKDQLDGHESY